MVGVLKGHMSHPAGQTGKVRMEDGSLSVSGY